MKKLVIAAIAAATILPSAAMAQPFGQSFGHHDAKVVVVDRNDHRSPGWNRPAVQRLTVGSRLEPGFIARQNVVKNPKRYRLAKTSGSTRWLKIRDDAVLVNLRTGRVLDIAYRLF